MNFQLEIVKQFFKACHERDKQLCLPSYIAAYEELNKLFGLLGSIFGFVSADVTSKLEILKSFQTENFGQIEFKTIHGMLKHEKQAGKLDEQHYISGSRTLLRLHRALEFIVIFLEKTSQLPSNSNLSTTCYESYNSTLANFHPAYLRIMVRGAVYTLPSRQGLLNKIRNEDRDESYYLSLLLEVVELGKKVYTSTQEFYAVEGLLELP